MDESTYVMGIDWGDGEDSTVVSVIDVERERVMAVTTVNATGHAAAVWYVKCAMELWQPVRVYSNANGAGDALNEQLPASVVGFAWAATNKARMCRQLHAAMADGDLNTGNMARLLPSALHQGARVVLNSDAELSIALAFYGLGMYKLGMV